MVDLTYEQVSELLTYDPETGKLFWRERARPHFSSQRSWRTWNARYSGKEASSVGKHDGYRTIKVLGASCKAHRVAWLLATGNFPKDDIDHINGDRSDNRLINLRAVSRTENMRNKGGQKRKSGACGVHLDPRLGRWQALICVNYRSISLGYFKSFNEALLARKAANVKYGFTERHGQ